MKIHSDSPTRIPTPVSQESGQETKTQNTAPSRTQTYRDTFETAGTGGSVTELYKSASEARTQGSESFERFLQQPFSASGGGVQVQSLKADMAKQSQLTEELNHLGLRPTPEGTAQTLQKLSQRPEPLQQLLTSARNAGSGSGTMEDVGKAAGNLAQRAAITGEDAAGLAYTVARAAQSGQASAMERPLAMAPGWQPRDRTTKSSDSDGEQTPWGNVKPGAIPDNPLEGIEEAIKKGKTSRGDGIAGIHDQDQGPDLSLSKGMPRLPEVPDPDDAFAPGSGEVDGGTYHGLNLGRVPAGQQGDVGIKFGGTFGPNFGVKSWRVTVDGSAGGVPFKAGVDSKGNFQPVGDAKEAVKEGLKSLRSGKSDKTTDDLKKEDAAFRDMIEAGIKRGKAKTGTAGPEGDSTLHPREDPQLLYRMTREADRKDRPRPDDAVSDPVYLKGMADRSAASAAQAAGGEVPQAQWNFIGKKPGSEVTDPAEPQGGGGEPEPAVRSPIRYEVADPPETAASTVATAQVGADQFASLLQRVVEMAIVSR